MLIFIYFKSAHFIYLFTYSCPDGSIFSNYECVNINECEPWNPCFNGSQCVDLLPHEGGYACITEPKESTIVASQGFVVAFVVCTIIFLLCKFFFFFAFCMWFDPMFSIGKNINVRFVKLQ